MLGNCNHRYSKTRQLWNKNNKILLILLIIQVCLFLSVVLFSGYFCIALRIILSALLLVDCISVIIFTLKTYDRNSFDDRFHGVRLEIFIFTFLSLFTSVANYWF